MMAWMTPQLPMTGPIWNTIYSTATVIRRWRKRAIESAPNWNANNSMVSPSNGKAPWRISKSIKYTMCERVYCPFCQIWWPNRFSAGWASPMNWCTMCMTAMSSTIWKRYSESIENVMSTIGTATSIALEFRWTMDRPKFNCWPSTNFRISPNSSIDRIAFGSLASYKWVAYDREASTTNWKSFTMWTNIRFRWSYDRPDVWIVALPNWDPSLPQMHSESTAKICTTDSSIWWMYYSIPSSKSIKTANTFLFHFVSFRVFFLFCLFLFYY